MAVRPTASTVIPAHRSVRSALSTRNAHDERGGHDEIYQSQILRLGPEIAPSSAMAASIIHP